MDALSIAVNAIGWTLIHSLWLGALAAAAYAVPAARLRNQAPQLAYGWGLTCLLALVLSLCLIFAHEFDRLRVSADAQAIARAYAALPVASMNQPTVAQDPGHTAITTWIESILPLLVLAWALAVAAIGSGLVRSQLALRRLVAAGTHLPQLAQPILELAERFGVNRPIAVISSAVARAPFVIGHFAPVIVLPLSVATGMPWPQLRLILAHEIAHLRRADYLINWLQIALEVLLFFHPAVRWLSEELRRLREACCDDLVVAFAGGRGDYTRALLSLEESRHDAPLLAPSAVAGGLLWRVQRIAGRAPDHRGAVQRVLLPTAIMSLLVLTLSGGLQIKPGYGPRDLILPQALLLTPSLLKLEVPPTRFEWSVDLPPLTPAASNPEPAQVPATASPAPIVVVAPTAERQGPSSVQVSEFAAAPEALQVPQLLAEPAVTAAPTERVDGDAISPTHAVRPVFPKGERLTNGPLPVELSFSVTPGGEVSDIRVVETATRPQVFVDAAIKALSQWTYDPGVHGSAQRLRHRFVFRDSNVNDGGTGECTMMTASRVCVVDARPNRDEAIVPGQRCKATTGSRLCRR